MIVLSSVFFVLGVYLLFVSNPISISRNREILRPKTGIFALLVLLVATISFPSELTVDTPWVVLSASPIVVLVSLLALSQRKSPSLSQNKTHSVEKNIDLFTRIVILIATASVIFMIYDIILGMQF